MSRRQVSLAPPGPHVARSARLAPRSAAALALALALFGCGPDVGPPEEPEPEATAGGEAEPELEGAEHPLRTTTPVPVPPPAVAREEMSEPLQQVWTQIEQTVALRPPEPPERASLEAVEAWAGGPFADWLAQRREQMSQVIQTSEDVAARPPYARAVSAALMGYAMEDLAADVRGAPVPEDIAADRELLEVYVANLQEVLEPIATEAVVYYAYCQQRIAALGDDTPWLPWRAYCVQRGQEMIEVYELQPAEDEGQDGEAPGAAGDGEAGDGEAGDGEAGDGEAGDGEAGDGEAEMAEEPQA